MKQKNQRAAFFDLDGTLTSEHTGMGYMRYFRERGLRRSTWLLYIVSHYPLYFMRRLGLISEGSFRAPWVTHMSWFLRGYTIEEAQEIWDWMADDFWSKCWRDDTRSLVEAHLTAGEIVVLVSSGPQPMIQRAAQELGTEHAVGTLFEVQDGYYTGHSLKPTCIDAFKASMTKDYLQNSGLDVDYDSSFTYADSTSDLHLLEMVGNPVAVHPDHGLRAVAEQRGWRIFPS
jgi:HAD superfamily hydrolase (TIGR01490 family)